MNVSVIIPSLNPDDKLMCVIESLIEKGFDDIILVNDGSNQEHMEPFNKAAQYSQCTILTHEVNRGKGRGLKTAFEYCIRNRKGIDGVVTVDGDNQHQADDILRCCQEMVDSDRVILGVRNFDGKDVPFKSRFGNHMTSFVFKILCGLSISDTQTGLRAIPYRYLDSFCQVAGERFEYETNMLLEFKKSGVPFKEEPISTVYIEENASTHFNPIKDSLKIYRVIFKYVFSASSFKYTVSSVASWLIDNIIFNVLEYMLLSMNEALRILISTVAARVCSSVFNFTVNRKWVFQSGKGVKSSVIRYYILWFFQMAASYGMVYFLTEMLNLGITGSAIAKIIVDLMLFCVSYKIQKKWVFK